MLTQIQIQNFFERGEIIKSNHDLSIYNGQNMYLLGTLNADERTGNYTINRETGNFLFLPYLSSGETFDQLDNNHPLFLTSTLTGCLFLAYTDSHNHVQVVHSNCNLTKKLSYKKNIETIRFHLIYDIEGNFRIEKLTSDGSRFNIINHPGNIDPGHILFCCYPETQTTFMQEETSCCKIHNKKIINRNPVFIPYKSEQVSCNVVGILNGNWSFQSINIIG